MIEELKSQLRAAVVQGTYGACGSTGAHKTVELILQSPAFLELLTRSDPLRCTVCNELPCLPIANMSDGTEKGSTSWTVDHPDNECSFSYVSVEGSTKEKAVQKWIEFFSSVGGGQDRKFAFRDGHFVNRVSGEKIPHDEPVIIFRARDWHSSPVLRHYLTLIEDTHHQQAVRERIDEFDMFAKNHPERMKEPGITRDIRLNKDVKSDESI